MKPRHIAHSISRDGRIVPGNGFKQPTPTVAMQNRTIWMHSIDRKDSATPIQGFLVFIGLIAALGAVLIWVR